MEHRAKTFCRICEAACGLETEGEGSQIELRPDRAHPISRGFVCAKGTRFGEVAFHPRRLRAPMIRRGGALEAVGWGRAIEEAAGRVRPILDRYGPHAVGLYVGNPLAFHALGQLSAVFFGRALGTRNVFTAGSQDCNNKFAAAGLMHGSPILHPIPDFDRAALAILFGTNPAVSQSSFVHLEGGASIFDRMRERGARVVWVDVRGTESAKRWGELVTVRPGTDVFLILALLGLVADRAPPSAGRDAQVERLEELLALAAEVPPARAATLTGVPEAAIRALADAIDRAPSTALHMSVGVNQGPFGTLAYVALQALAYRTGNYDREGGSMFSPVAVHGARLARAAGLFTSDRKSRIGGFPTVFESLPGGIMADEILTEGAERVRAMIVIAGDPLRSIPGAKRLERAFERLDALIAIDLFESLTGRHADVLLPATSWLERADFALPSLPLQTVDLLQTSSAVLPRVGEARPEHEILAQLSLALDRPMFGSRLAARTLAREGLADRVIPAVVEAAWRVFDRDPARRGHGVRVPAARQGRYLGRGPLTPGHRVRFWDAALDAERERLRAWRPSSSGFVLLGRRRRIGHNSWLHGGTREGTREPEAWMAAADLERLGVEEGGMVSLSTSEGELKIAARAKEGVVCGTVVVPHGELDVNVNELLPAGAAHIEPISGQLHMSGIPVEVRAVEQVEAHERGARA